MTIVSELDQQVKAANLARLEAIEQMFPVRPPALIADLIPPTTNGSVLEASVKDAMRLWEELAASYTAFTESPYDESVVLKTRFIDWTGVDGAALYMRSLRMPDKVPGLAAIKHGKGRDPHDGQVKNYILFNRVREDAYRVGVGEFWDMLPAYYELLEKWAPLHEAGDERAGPLKEKLNALNREQYDWRRAWEVRVAPPERRVRVQRIQEIGDEINAIELEIYDRRQVEDGVTVGKIKVSPDHPKFVRREQLRRELKQLEGGE